MAEPGGPTPATPPGPPTPAEGRLWAIAQRALVRGWPGVKRYLRQVWGSFLTLAVLAYVAQLYAAGTLHRWNDRFLEGVSQLRPWRLAQVFYGALFAGGLFDLCQVCRRVVIYLFPLNMPYALYHTGRSLLAEGAVGLGTAVVAYLLGLLVVVVREQRKIPEAAEWEAVWVKVLVFAPLIGSMLMWGLWHVMRLASLLFGWPLAAVAMITYLSVSVPALGWLIRAALKPAEQAFEARVMGGGAGRAAGAAPDADRGPRPQGGGGGAAAPRPLAVSHRFVVPLFILEYNHKGGSAMRPPDQHRSEPRATVRFVARLDAATQAKVDDLARRFHQPRAAIVCAIMRWGLRRGPTGAPDQGQAHGAVRHLHLYVDTALHARAAQAASAAGVKLAPWLRQMVRQIALTDFPASWRAAQSRERSHDSRIYDTRFMRRSDTVSRRKLQQLVTQVGASKAEIIRQLIMQATPDDFPRNWPFEGC